MSPIQKDFQETRVAARFAVTTAISSTAFWFWLIRRYKIQERKFPEFCLTLTIWAPVFATMTIRASYKLLLYYLQQRFMKLARFRLYVVYAAGRQSLVLLVAQNMTLGFCLKTSSLQAVATGGEETLPPFEGCWFYLQGQRLSQEQLAQPIGEVLKMLPPIRDLDSLRQKTLMLTVVDARKPTLLWGLHSHFGASSSVRVLRRLDRRVVGQVFSFLKRAT